MPFTFEIKDFVDIIAVAALLYYIFRLMRESRSINVFLGIIVITIVWLLVSQVFEMRLLGSIMDKLVNVGVIALFILFQAEIRKFLYNLGAHERFKMITAFMFSKSKGKEINKDFIMGIVRACISMSKKKIGALIVLECSTPLDDVADSGDIIDAKITQRLIENIFFKNSPLHDGAMIISKKRIKAAGCILPVSHDLNIPKNFGLRHRSALGVTQESDAIAIIVSEETGNITIAEKSNFRYRLTYEQLESFLTHEYMKLS